MNRFYTRLFRRRIFLLALGISILFLAAGNKAVSAAEQAYLIKVNRACNTITVYEKDKKGAYTVPVKAMLCSVGTGNLTITGTFQTKAKYRWKLLMGDVYGQYATRIVKGILFHSVYYYENNNPASLSVKQYNKLGTAASHGCIRVNVADAKWIYDNCPIGTTVVVYDDKKNPGPLGKPKALKITAANGWDPTDPDPKNPYLAKAPEIKGAKDLTVVQGKKLNLLSGITAVSATGSNITKQVKVKGKVDVNTPGKYEITYTVKDTLGMATDKTILVTVEESDAPVEFAGIRDRVVKDEALITRELALDGVEAYQDGKKLDQSKLKVIIEKLEEGNYFLTYQVLRKDKILAEEHADVVVDTTAPVFLNVPELDLASGEVPSADSVLSGVTVVDNYSEDGAVILEADIAGGENNDCRITVKATDEAGNTATADVVIHYH
ncbi:MAG TPA: DUF5011 domain-containing protein [Clostridiales bacterium]|nr:DUF5011 domain-containing protein [Clostridiales bacterium]